MRWSRLPPVVAMLRSCGEAPDKSAWAQDGIHTLHFFVMCQVAIAHHGANLQSAVAFRFNAVERQSVYIDQQLGALDIEFHQVDQGSATSVVG